MKTNSEIVKSFFYEAFYEMETEALVKKAAFGTDLEKEVAERILMERKEKSETKTIEDVVAEMKELHTSMKELGFLNEDSDFEEITKKVFKEVYGIECDLFEDEEDEFEVELIPGYVYLEKNQGIEFLFAMVDYYDILDQPVFTMINLDNGNRLVSPMPIEIFIDFLNDNEDEFDFEMLGKVKTYN